MKALSVLRTASRLGRVAAARSSAAKRHGARSAATAVSAVKPGSPLKPKDEVGYAARARTNDELPTTSGVGGLSASFWLNVHLLPLRDATYGRILIAAGGAF